MPKLGNPAPSKNDQYWWDDYDDFRHNFMRGPLIHDITVYEDDKEPVMESIGILGPNGKPIYVVHESESMPFIGFINPDHYALYREEAEKERKKKARKEKRRAAAR